MSKPSRELTYGEAAVGISFNPSADKRVDELKNLYANIIDLLDGFRKLDDVSDEAKRLYAIAITNAQGAQMWAVKAVTWRDA